MPQTYSYSFQMTVKHTCFFKKKTETFQEERDQLDYIFFKTKFEDKDQEMGHSMVCYNN